MLKELHTVASDLLSLHGYPMQSPWMKAASTDEAGGRSVRTPVPQRNPADNAAARDGRCVAAACRLEPLS